MKSAAVVALFWILAVSFSRQAPQPAEPSDSVAFPQGYRGWAHIKSTLLSPSANRFGLDGGFHHIYANPVALSGYRSREFPEGSVIVFDWLAMTERDGLYLEGARRRVDVMLKDSSRFRSTGGWGFARFVGESRTQSASKAAPAQCFGCHQTRQRDGLVLSTLRD